MLLVGGILSLPWSGSRVSIPEGMAGVDAVPHAMRRAMSLIHQPCTTALVADAGDLHLARTGRAVRAEQVAALSDKPQGHRLAIL